MNDTLSISLKTSWTNSIVSFNRIPKPAPLFNQQAIWRAPSDAGFYIWGGVTSYFARPPAVEVWKLVADGNGKGEWHQEPITGVTEARLIRFTRTAQLAYTHSPTVGFWIGGYANAQTDIKVTGDGYLAPPGVMSFDMVSGELKNESSAGLHRYGTLVGGSAQWVPYGSEGSLVFLGGAEAPVSTTYNGWAGVSFASLPVWDVFGKLCTMGLKVVLTLDSQEVVSTADQRGTTNATRALLCCGCSGAQQNI